MSLRVWTQLDDDYDHEQMADNWAKLDAHDHTNGRGVQIPTEGIAKEAITPELLAEEVVLRLLSATETYGEAETVVSGKPTTAAGKTIVQATVKVKTSSGKVKLEIKVGGSNITTLELSKVESDQQIPLHFFVPDGVAWEWKSVEGTATFAFKTVVL